MVMGVWNCWCLTVKVQRSRSLSTKSTRWVFLRLILKASESVWHSIIGANLTRTLLFSLCLCLRAPLTHGCVWFPGPSLALLPEELKWWCTPKRLVHTHASLMEALGIFVRWSLLHTLALVSLSWQTDISPTTCALCQGCKIFFYWFICWLFLWLIG